MVAVTKAVKILARWFFGKFRFFWVILGCFRGHFLKQRFWELRSPRPPIWEKFPKNPVFSFGCRPLEWNIWQLCLHLQSNGVTVVLRLWLSKKQAKWLLSPPYCLISQDLNSKIVQDWRLTPMYKKTKSYKRERKTLSPAVYIPSLCSSATLARSSCQGYVGQERDQ